MDTRGGGVRLAEDCGRGEEEGSDDDAVVAEGSHGRKSKHPLSFYHHSSGDQLVQNSPTRLKLEARSSCLFIPLIIWHVRTGALRNRAARLCPNAGNSLARH